jgi:hypothetical protein
LERAELKQTGLKLVYLPDLATVLPDEAVMLIYPAGQR